MAAIDPELLLDFCDEASKLVVAATTAHSTAVKRQIEQALELGGDIRLAYSPKSGRLTVALIQPGGHATTIFAERLEPGLED